MSYYEPKITKKLENEWHDLLQVNLEIARHILRQISEETIRAAEKKVGPTGTWEWAFRLGYGDIGLAFFGTVGAADAITMAQKVLHPSPYDTPAPWLDEDLAKAAGYSRQ